MGTWEEKASQVEVTTGPEEPEAAAARARECGWVRAESRKGGN